MKKPNRRLKQKSGSDSSNSPSIVSSDKENHDKRIRDLELENEALKAITQAIEHELEVTIRVHEVRSEYDRQMAERARMAKEVSRLKEEAEILKHGELRDCPETMSPGARNSRIFALENMLAATSSTLVSMASQLSEAEERERIFSGRGRWNHVRSLADAKNIMNYLFNLASSSRCSLRDKEVNCREKDAEIRELKEKVVKLSSVSRQLAAQKADLVREVKMKGSVIIKHSIKGAMDSDIRDSNGGSHELRKQEQQSSLIFMEDMDTSESEHSDMNARDDDDCVQSEKKPARRKAPRARARTRARNLRIHKSDANDLEGINGCVGEVPVKTDGLCCSCSKKSLCKTPKCQCRANGSSRGKSCGCSSVKCSNREAEEANIMSNYVGTNNEEKSLVARGAMLLQNALEAGQKAAETNDDGATKRKALTDIGNTLAKPNAPKLNKRKKWRKSVIQLIPVAPPSSQPENNAPPQNSKNVDPLKKPDSCPSESDIPLKLPKAMRSAASSSNGSGKLLRVRNADQKDQSTNKELTAAILAPTSSPGRPARTSEEKENRRR